MSRYTKFLLILAVIVVAALLVGQLAYKGGYFIGSH